MKRYVLDQFFDIRQIRDEKVIIDDEHGGMFRLERDGLALVQYNDVRVVGRLDDGKELMLVAVDDGSSLPMDSPQELKTRTECLDAESGAELDMDPMRLAALLHRSSPNERYTYFTLRASDKNRGCRIAVYDWDHSSSKMVELGKEYEYLIISQLGEECFGVCGAKERRFIKFDSSLNVVWETIYRREISNTLAYQAPVRMGGYLLDRVGARISKQGGLGSRPIFADGEVVCLDTETGELLWSESFEYHVDSLKPLDDSRLAVLVANKIHVVDVHSAETIRVIDSGLEELTRSGFLFVDDTFCYLLSNDFHKILVYDKQRFDLAREYVGEEGRTPFRNEPKIVNGYVLVRMGYGLASSELLVIDPKDIDAPLSVESLDHLEVTIPEDEDGPIVLEVSDSDICKVLRHVEHHCIELADCHGQEGRGLEYNKYFNGQIILRYKTDQVDEALCKLLDRLVERVNSKIRGWGIMAGIGGELCSLTYELVS